MDLLASAGVRHCVETRGGMIFSTSYPLEVAHACCGRPIRGDGEPSAPMIPRVTQVLIMNSFTSRRRRALTLKTESHGLRGTNDKGSGSCTGALDPPRWKSRFGEASIWRRAHPS